MMDMTLMGLKYAMILGHGANGLSPVPMPAQVDEQSPTAAPMTANVKNDERSHLIENLLHRVKKGTIQRQYCAMIL